MSKREILLIDNLDSFSFNLVESFQRLGCTGQTWAAPDRRFVTAFPHPRPSRSHWSEKR